MNLQGGETANPESPCSEKGGKTELKTGSSR